MSVDLTIFFQVANDHFLLCTAIVVPLHKGIDKIDVNYEQVAVLA